MLPEGTRFGSIANATIMMSHTNGGTCSPTAVYAYSKWMLVGTSFAALSLTPPRGTLKDPEAPSVRLRGESATHGWIIDAYGDYDRDSMVLWLWNERGAHRIEDPRFLPQFYLNAAPTDQQEIRRRTGFLDGVRVCRGGPRRYSNR